MGRGWLGARCADPVVLVLKSGKTLRGWIELVSRDAVVLRAAQVLLDEVPDPVQLDGLVTVARENIDWAQIEVASWQLYG